MRIAVASKSGRDVDQHFGHAERFLVYEVDEELAELVDEVRVEKYCSFDPDHALRKPQFKAIVEALVDCRVVVTARIGEYPQHELEKAGLKHFASGGEIEAAVRSAHDSLNAASGA
ncbi:MAG: dinitrogenase iron-molybdenum cofactor biosynthesis protein [Desulfuromonadales bacterium]|nr:dinitrogenase iron-molybdenum cofactor biosynthesis protein [Desulfuromonadales bacterium]NIR34100.1 dinitrogenase iron-molybdenum cofactor biosynthesis protein [Desulfuromonadales bacterium]NIS41556.1 dinitrogenase iron-molybdenum cofactor biosynthesis protein [Desulfuromonadales bacterium]